MNKTIKIRFIDKFGTYYIQKKTLFGWNYIIYKIVLMGGEISYRFNNEDKKELLKEVITQHFGLCVDCVKIIEYPTIKYYNYN
jgi:hypothetical protein